MDEDTALPEVNDPALRMSALHVASTTTGATGNEEAVLLAARKYYEFLRGDPETPG